MRGIFHLLSLSHILCMNFLLYFKPAYQLYQTTRKKDKNTENPENPSNKQQIFNVEGRSSL